MTMTKLIKWNGDTTNLARFGIVKKGDVIRMATFEWEYVQRNKDDRYKPATADDLKAPNPNLIKIDAKKMKPSEIEEAEKHNAKEALRLEQLNARCLESEVIFVQLQSMTTIQLVGMVEEINSALKVPIMILDRNTTRHELLSSIRSHLTREGIQPTETPAEQQARDLQDQEKSP